MLRPARVWTLLLALAGACSGSGESEPRDPNQPAGKVVELSGQVSAARDGAAVRPLAVGGEVFADDTVTTGPDGAAVILLAHNHVRWSLGTGKSLRVDRSMAWKATSDQGGSAFDDQDPMATASAGRHTDREAGDTAATAQLPPAAAEAAPAPPLEAPNAASDSLARAEPTGGGAGGSEGMAQKGATTRGRSAAPPRKKMLAEGSASGEGAGAERALEVGGATAAAPTAPPDLEQSSSAPAPAGGTPRATVVLGKLKVKGALSAAQVSGPLGQAGRGCRGTVAGKLTLRFDIDRTGKVTNVRLSGSSKVVSPISACVTQAVRALAFPAAESGTTAVERDIEVSLSR